MSLGPFTISPLQISRLDSGFTAVINQLLAVEAAAAGMVGSSLTLNHIESIADGGVDASIHGAPGGDWIPPGESAWQFKRSNLSPKQCADEFRKSTWPTSTLKTVVRM